MVRLANSSPHPNEISIGSAVFAGLMIVTDRPTNRPRARCSGHIYIRSTAMRPKKMVFTVHCGYCTCRHQHSSNTWHYRLERFVRFKLIALRCLSLVDSSQQSIEAQRSGDSCQQYLSADCTTLSSIAGRDQIIKKIFDVFIAVRVLELAFYH